MIILILLPLIANTFFDLCTDQTLPAVVKIKLEETKKEKYIRRANIFFFTPEHESPP